MWTYSIELLSKQHNKKDFRCGTDELDHYFRQQAGQEARRHVAATFVLIENDTRNIAGFYTLSSTSVDVSQLPETQLSKLPKYPILPATLLARLAVDKRYQGKKLGELLLIDAMKRSLKSSYEIGAIAIVVDAKNDNVVGFYKKYGFIQFNTFPAKLFFPMSTVKSIWKNEVRLNPTLLQVLP